MTTYTPTELYADGHSVKRKDGTTFAVADTADIAHQIAALPVLLSACEGALIILGTRANDTTAQTLRTVIARAKGET